MQPLSYQKSTMVIQNAMKNPHQVLAVGIDIAKDTHVAIPLRGTGQQLDKSLSFSSQKRSLENCAQWMEHLAHNASCDHLLVGMEPTNLYWRAVYNYLVPRLPWSAIYIVPSINVHWARRMNGSNLSKTDPRDASIIAQLVLNGKCDRPLTHTPVTRQLRVTLHDYITNDKIATAFKRRLVDMLQVAFPEAVSQSRGSTVEGRLRLLRDTPTPAEIKAVSRETWITERIARGVSRTTLNTLYQKACDSTAVPPDTSYWRQLWTTLYSEWHHQCLQRDTLYEFIATMVRDIPRAEVLFTIPGISTLTIASFFAGAGDISQYDRAAQVEKVFGFDLHRWQSGQMNATPHITKRGYSPARRNFYLAARSAAQRPPFDDWYERHFSDNTHKGAKKVLTALAAKLVRICFQIARTGKTFDPTLAVEHK